MSDLRKKRETAFAREKRKTAFARAFTSTLTFQAIKKTGLLNKKPTAKYHFLLMPFSVVPYHLLTKILIPSICAFALSESAFTISCPANIQQISFSTNSIFSGALRYPPFTENPSTLFINLHFSYKL